MKCQWWMSLIFYASDMCCSFDYPATQATNALHYLFLGSLDIVVKHTNGKLNITWSVFGAEAEALKNGVNRRCDFRAHCRRLADLANIDCEFYFLFARVGDGCVITHTSNTHRPYGKHVLRLCWKRRQRWRGDVGIFRLLGRSINCLCSQNVYSSACSYAGNIYIRATLSHNVAYVYRVQFVEQVHTNSSGAHRESLRSYCRFYNTKVHMIFARRRWSTLRRRHSNISIW